MPPPGDRPEGQPRPVGAPVRMLRPHLHDIAAVPFPEGFGIRPFVPGDQGLWVDIQRDAEAPFAIDHALFDREFGADLPSACRRCFFVVDPRGCAVGAISAWYLREFRGTEWGRVHWVAVRPAFQGRGLGRASLSYTLQRLAEWHERALLTTHTSRLPAIKLYLDAGFVPDLLPDGAVDAWKELRARLPHPALEGLLTPITR